MSHVITFIVGAMVGGCAGVMAMCLVRAGSDYPESIFKDDDINSNVL